MKHAFKKYLLLAAIAPLIVLVAGTQAAAGLVWRADITASVLADSNTLILGQAKDATDGFENAYESRAILSGYLMAYFYYPEWGVDTAYFWSDIKRETLPKQWQFYVASQYTNRDITLRWSLGDVPETLNLYLVDETSGDIIDMKSASAYSYFNTSTAERRFTVEASGSITISDSTPPDVSITEAPAGFAASSAAITYTGADDITPADLLEYSYSLDGSAWSVWSTQTTAYLNDLREGAHVFSVKARDEAGNEDPTPAQAEFTVDTAAPTLILNDSVTRLKARRMVDVTVSGSVVDGISGVDSVSYLVIDEYNEYGGGGAITLNGNNFLFTVSLSTRKNPLDAKGRRYVIIVTAVDKAGNPASGSITIVVPLRNLPIKGNKYF